MRVKVGILTTALLLCGCGDMNSKPVTAMVIAERNDKELQEIVYPWIMEQIAAMAALEAKVQALEANLRDLMRSESDN